MNGWILIALLVLAALGHACCSLSPRPLRARWREPVFRHPLLVIESDDWGAGPLAQEDALRNVAAVLRSFRDSAGRHPVMTLGIVFEVPDTERMAREGLQAYRPLRLDEARFGELRRVMQEGIEAAVFAPQLHGQCHYWPQALMAAAQDDAGVRAWLTGPRLPQTENLPSHLQTRWVDASHLPSRASRRGADCRGGRGRGGELSEAFSAGRRKLPWRPRSSGTATSRQAGSRPAWRSSSRRVGAPPAAMRRAGSPASIGRC